MYILVKEISADLT